MKTPGEQLTSQEVIEIIALWKLGIPKLQIANRYSKHHSTIIYHINKHISQETGQPVARKRIGKGTCKDRPIKLKSYHDYLIDDEDRARLRRESCLHQHQILTVRCRDCGDKHEQEVWTKSDIDR